MIETTKSGFAFSVGEQDNTVSRDKTIAPAAEIVSATDWPVSADIEIGFEDDPQSSAETIRRALAQCYLIANDTH